MTPSIPTVQAILTRASLPVEIIALAACILDSLDSRLARTWRLGCPLSTPSSSSSPEPHIDNVCPEILVLAALILSAQFLDDVSSCTRTYVRDWGCGVWSCEQLNFSLRCVLENIGYSLLPLCSQRMIQDAMADMERAARRADVVQYRYDASQEENAPRDVDGKCEMVTGIAEQLTPAETPTLEKTYPLFTVASDQFSRGWDYCPGISDSCG